MHGLPQRLSHGLLLGPNVIFSPCGNHLSPDTFEQPHRKQAFYNFFLVIQRLSLRANQIDS